MGVRVCVGDLYDDAFLGFSGSSEEGCAGCVFKDFPDAVVHFGGTFEIPSCSNLTGNCFSLHTHKVRDCKGMWVCYLFRADGSLLGFTQFIDCFWIISQVLFASDQDDWQSLTEM